MEQWDVDRAQSVARELMAGLGDRWDHVQGVAAAAEALVQNGADPVVALAAWLHDVGYAPTVIASGFHPLDGARFLVGVGAPPEVVSLVAYHTGAEYEAVERGLATELEAFARPSQESLEALTLADLTVGPSGERMTVDQRLAEIVRRYPEHDPVHRAIGASGPYLRECAARAESRYTTALRT